MPPSLNEDALSEHDLLELQANAVIELAAADDLASGLARVVTSIRRFAAAPRVELWSSGDDGMPTLLAAAGEADITQKLLDGYTVGGKTYKVHLDGYNQIPYLTGETKESARNAIMYFSDDGEVIAVRVGDYKFQLAEQRANQMKQWAEPFVKLRLPYIMNLRRDPFERAEFNSNTYLDWMVDHVPQMYQMQALVASEG